MQKEECTKNMMKNSDTGGKGRGRSSGVLSDRAKEKADNSRFTRYIL